MTRDLRAELTALAADAPRSWVSAGERAHKLAPEVVAAINDLERTLVGRVAINRGNAYQLRHDLLLAAESEARARAYELALEDLRRILGEP